MKQRILEMENKLRAILKNKYGATFNKFEICYSAGDKILYGQHLTVKLPTDVSVNAETVKQIFRSDTRSLNY